MKYCFEPKLNFWNQVLLELINLPVSNRCYNQAGHKIKATEDFLKGIASSTNFSEYTISTIIAHFHSIIDLAKLMAVQYDKSAHELRATTSPEHQNREMYAFVRKDDESWTQSDEYNGVIMLPEVSSLAPNVLKKPFQFNFGSNSINGPSK